MKARTFTPMGSLHPILFFAGVYVVALIFSIFICSSLFYSCNASSVASQETTIKASPATAFDQPVGSGTYVALKK